MNKKQMMGLLGSFILFIPGNAYADHPTIGFGSEIAGRPILDPQKTGKPFFQHLKEVQDAQRGLVKEIQRLKWDIGNPSLSTAERVEIQRQLSEASRLLDHTEGFIPR